MIFLKGKQNIDTSIIDDIQDFQQFGESKKKRVSQLIEVGQKSSKNWISKIGFLMLLENAYAYDLGHLLTDSSSKPREFINRWLDWRINIFNPKEILNICNELSIDQIMLFYNDLCHLGHSEDPLSNWYPLLQLIDSRKKSKLRLHALLAQEYYKLAKMVAYFVYDVTKEKMPDPDDVTDGRSGSWKPEIYGKPFDYETPKTQNRILDNYLIHRPIRIALVYEGESEDIAIKILFDILNVDQHTDGIFLWNSKGQDKIKNNIHSIYALAKANGADLFVILDRDADWNQLINDSIKQGYLKKDNYHLWNKDFETDNYDISSVVKILNEELKMEFHQGINRTMIEAELNGSHIGLYKAISDLVWKQARIPLHERISKTDLARIIFQGRAEEIKNEIENDEWIPKLPIEHVLHKIFIDTAKFVG